MDFITESDLLKIQEYAGEESDSDKHTELRVIYDKLGFLCEKLAEKGYEYDIRRDPRAQAGPGEFRFQDYQWAKFFPPGFKVFCNKKFAYIIDLSETLEFHMMGIGSYQKLPPSLKASEKCRKDVNITGSNYDMLVEEFIKFDQQYRSLFVDTAIELGIQELLSIKKNMDTQEIIELLAQEKQIILQGPPGTGKTRLAESLAAQLASPDNIELIQFHPAYTYEDFVRGITARSNGTQVEYKTENRTLGILAQKAQKNYLDSRRPPKELSKEKWVSDELDLFRETIQDKLDAEGKYRLNESVYIFDIDEDAFKYSGDNWAASQRMKYKDIVLAYLNNAQNRQDIKATPGISGRGISHATYDFIVLEKFRGFLERRPTYGNGEVQVSLQTFVLIIDEINRANLPAVLGELIYALEYRGKVVKSLYDLDGNKDLVIPTNLYIIGTMNTADRSIGHIDYAIRRRFPSVEIVPSAAVINKVVPDKNGLKEKAKKLFSDVATFFTEDSLSPDFKAKEVQLGHSYFLAQTENELGLKLKYSIKPLLREYLKDGIFRSELNAEGKDAMEEKIDNLSL